MPNMWYFVVKTGPKILTKNVPLTMLSNLHQGSMGKNHVKVVKLSNSC